jgi:hypothetical protein
MKKNFQTEIIDSGIRLMIISVKSGFSLLRSCIIKSKYYCMLSKYSVENYTRTLLGPEYFIYTPQFRKLGIQPVKQLGKKILVLLGRLTLVIIPSISGTYIENKKFKPI